MYVNKIFDNKNKDSVLIQITNLDIQNTNLGNI